MAIDIDILTRVSGKSIRLQITDDGKLSVRAPHLVPRFVINRFVQSRKDWITRSKKSVMLRARAVKTSYRQGSEIRIAGKPYVLHITEGNRIVVAGSRIFFPRKFLSDVRFHLKQWGRVFAKKLFTARLDIYSVKMGVTYKKISIRDMSSRWGSCSSTGAISFSYKLIFAELSIIDYIVVHELAHLLYQDHKKNFWNQVEKFYPHYKAARIWLRREGHVLQVH